MGDNKNFVKDITNIEEDFAQWYTDIVLKAELADYTNVRIYINSSLWIWNMGKYTKLCR